MSGERDPAEAAFYEWAREDCPEILNAHLCGGHPPPELRVWLAAAQAERERCVRLCRDAAGRWPENPHAAAILNSIADEIGGR